MRSSTVWVLARASTHSVSSIRIGQVQEPGEPGHHQDRHRAVGALGEAAARVHPQRLRPGPGVGGHRAHHQAVERTGTGRGSCRQGPRSRGRGRRRSRRRRSGRAWSRRTRRTWSCARGAGHRPVDEVAEDERGDEQDPGEQVAAREERERADADTERADERDGVGADAQSQEQAHERRQHDVLPEALEPVQHVPRRLPVDACATAAGARGRSLAEGGVATRGVA